MRKVAARGLQNRQTKTSATRRRATEDRMDALVSVRRLREKAIPFETALNRLGYRLDARGKPVRA